MTAFSARSQLLTLAPASAKATSLGVTAAVVRFLWRHSSNEPISKEPISNQRNSQLDLLQKLPRSSLSHMAVRVLWCAGQRSQHTVVISCQHCRITRSLCKAFDVYNMPSLDKTLTVRCRTCRTRPSASVVQVNAHNTYDWLGLPGKPICRSLPRPADRHLCIWL